MSRLSPNTLRIVRSAYERAAKERQEAEEHLARLDARVVEQRGYVQEAREVERDLAATLDAHRRAIVAEEAETRRALGDARGLGEPLRGKDDEAPAPGALPTPAELIDEG